MTELGTAAVDCPHGRMHPLEDDFIFEIVQDDLATPAAPGAVGPLVVTALKRRATPVFRYLTGDLARVVPAACACGARTRLELRGRGADAIAAPERRFGLADLARTPATVPGRRRPVGGPAP